MLVGLSWVSSHANCSHVRTADIDAPIQLSGGSKGSEPSPEQVAMLADMGFTAAQAKKALRETVRGITFTF